MRKIILAGAGAVALCVSAQARAQNYYQQPYVPRVSQAYVPRAPMPTPYIPGLSPGVAPAMPQSYAPPAPSYDPPPQLPMNVACERIGQFVNCESD